MTRRVKSVEPHVFQEVDLLSMAKPQGHIVMGPYTPPPMPAGKSVVCGICKKPRGDRIHIEGETQADAESPRWGL
jgi:hypothetical protein